MSTYHIPESNEAEIQKVAYHIWLEHGCEPGRELDHWLAAHEWLNHHYGRTGGGRARNRRLPRKTVPSASAA